MHDTICKDSMHVHQLTYNYNLVIYNDNGIIHDNIHSGKLKTHYL